MKKGLKIFFRIIIILLIIVILPITVLGFVIYDQSEGDYTYDANNAKSMSTVVADSVGESLDIIANSSYKNNTITLSLNMQELNDILTVILRNNVNESYLSTDSDYLFSLSNIANVKKVYFESDGDDLSARADVGALGFYKSNAKITTDVSVDEDNRLVFTISDTSLGKVSLKTKRIEQILKALKNSLENDSGSIIVDTENLCVKLDLKKMISDSVDNPIIRDLISTIQYNLEVAGKRVNLSIDTASLITGKADIKSASNSGLIDKFASAIAALLGASEAKIVISEENFNYLIKSSLEEGLEQFESSYTLGGVSFDMAISDPYFDITSMSLLTNLKINQIYTSLTLGLDYSITYDSYNLADKILFDVNSATLGETKLDNIDGFDFEFSIKEALMSGYPMLLLKDFAFDQSNSTVILTTIAAI